MGKRSDVHGAIIKNEKRLLSLRKSEEGHVQPNNDIVNPNSPCVLVCHTRGYQNAQLLRGTV
jgi:hypothetical protein